MTRVRVPPHSELAVSVALSFLQVGKCGEGDRRRRWRSSRARPLRAFARGATQRRANLAARRDDGGDGGRPHRDVQRKPRQPSFSPAALDRCRATIAGSAPPLGGRRRPGPISALRARQRQKMAAESSTLTASANQILGLSCALRSLRSVPVRDFADRPRQSIADDGGGLTLACKGLCGGLPMPAGQFFSHLCGGSAAGDALHPSRCVLGDVRQYPVRVAVPPTQAMCKICNSAGPVVKAGPVWSRGKGEPTPWIVDVDCATCGVQCGRADT